MKQKNNSNIFWGLSVLYSTIVLISNILAGRLITVFGISLTGAVVLFPLTYILGDIFTEVYGYKKNRLVIWMGFINNLIMVASFYLILKLPYPQEFKNETAYEIVLGTTPRIFIGSFLGFLVGSYTNSIIISKMKVITKGKYLALRTILSTVFGEFMDTIIFISIVFGNSYSYILLRGMIANQALIKISFEVIFTPILYIVVRKIKKVEKIDVFDINVKYQIFK